MALDEPVFNLVEEVVHGGFDGVIEQIGEEWYDLSNRPGSVLVMDRGRGVFSYACLQPIPSLSVPMLSLEVIWQS